MESTLELWRVIDEPVGVVLGLVIVWCLIKENVWAWPLGVAYVLVLSLPLWEARLYSNLLLHLLGFLPLNLYGWYYWLFGGAEKKDVLHVTRSSGALLVTIAAICAVGTAALGAYFAATSDAAYPYLDNLVTVMSLSAMWMTARKKIENWIVWFVVDVISVVLYGVQGLYLLAALYFVYLGMAVMGYRAWSQSMALDAATVAARR